MPSTSQSSQRASGSHRQNAGSSQRQSAGSSQRQSAGSSQRQSNQTATQNMSQADKAASTINKEELDQRVTDLVQYMLIMWQKNVPIKKHDEKGAGGRAVDSVPPPLKRSVVGSILLSGPSCSLGYFPFQPVVHNWFIKGCDINKNVLKEHSKAFGHIMKKATDKLEKVFGAKVVELQEKQKGCYILVNCLENDSKNPHLDFPDLEHSKTGLLMVTLSLIFMNGNLMQDAELWHTLKKFGIDTNYTHDVFGDIKKLITQEFVRQGFLEYNRQPNSDPPTYDFAWGQRAHLETSKKYCLEFVSQIYDMEPEQWTSQYQDVMDQKVVDDEASATDNNVSTSRHSGH